jgi:hypothetical protein
MRITTIATLVAVIMTISVSAQPKPAPGRGFEVQPTQEEADNKKEA